MTDVKKKLALTMYVGGIPVSEIAEELEISVPTVYSWLEARNLSADIREGKYDEAIRMYTDTDTPVSVICSTLNVSPPTLYKCICTRGVSKRSSKSKLTEDKEQDIVELYQSGTPVSDICSMYSIAPPTLYATLRKHEIEPSRHHRVATTDISTYLDTPGNHTEIEHRRLYKNNPNNHLHIGVDKGSPDGDYTVEVLHNLDEATYTVVNMEYTPPTINHILTDYDKDTEL